jgi:hypothetical protein
MKMFKTVGLVLAVAGMMTFSAQAVKITGHISFSTANGTWTGDGGDVNTIETIVSFGATHVNSASGDFGGIANGTMVTMGEPLKFTAPTIINNPLWAVGGFEFDLLTITAINRNDNPGGLDSLGLAGRGTIRDTSAVLEDTTGFWVWSGDMNGVQTFTFSSTTIAAVPDGGGTLILLGSVILGLFGVARKSFRIG